MRHKILTLSLDNITCKEEVILIYHMIKKHTDFRFLIGMKFYPKSELVILQSRLNNNLSSTELIYLIDGLVGSLNNSLERGIHQKIRQHVMSYD